MKTQSILAGAVLAGGILTAALPAVAATDLHVSINLGNAPPPPVVVVQHAPRTVWLPEQRVYVANDPDFDDDYFQCGMFWYAYRNNYWYRARSWRGPFTVIDYHYVPQSVLVVPSRHWRHPWGGPPGRAMYVERRGGGVERVKVKEHGHGKWKDDDDRGHGRGHDRDHDRDDRDHDDR